MFFTTDKNIRVALRSVLDKHLETYCSTNSANIFEEFGVQHGAARIDIAVVNGVMHGYEIKSDRDSLERLPEQINEFNAVFDKITLVVGKRHLYDAINMVPDWWGITIAKMDLNGSVFFQDIREPEENQNQSRVSIARLLWRDEALQILDHQDKAKGVRSKPREYIYQRLSEVFDIDSLREKVRDALLIRDWRSDGMLLLSDDLTER